MSAANAKRKKAVGECLFVVASELCTEHIILYNMCSCKGIACLICGSTEFFKVRAAWPLPPDLLVGKVGRGQVVENLLLVDHHLPSAPGAWRT